MRTRPSSSPSSSRRPARRAIRAAGRRRPDAAASVAKVDEFVEADPSWKPLIEGIAYGGPEPLFKDYKGFQNVMIELVQSVVTGAAAPADALKKAAADLEQYK